VTLWGAAGTFWDYSNNGTVLAAQAIESVLGELRWGRDSSYCLSAASGQLARCDGSAAQKWGRTWPLVWDFVPAVQR
jgi:hypothetical protein